MNTHKLPLGVDNFQELAQEDYLFCDKTTMIAEFLGKGDKVTLITRPRRWGKTLNISMLHCFFASEVNGVSTAGLFDELAIGKIEGGSYLHQHQGKYPVIMISFKDVNADSFQGAYNAVYRLIIEIYSSYAYLLKSNKINEIQLGQLHTILNKQANQQQLEASLELLSQCLYQHHGQKVYILIDEYDTPLNKAYGNKEYLDAMVAFMRNLFSAALKGNTSSASRFDTQLSKTSEGFYHGFVLAILASLDRTHYIRSNRESGMGRYDLLLIPKKEGSKALLLEFKQVRKEEELENASKLALDQIQA
ncbi:MAG: AAA family ATPase [Candidatus Cardinium sp.]